MSDTNAEPVAPAAPKYSLSNITDHASSTWTAIGLVLAAAAPIVNAGVPQSQGEWILTLGTLAAAVMKALGR